MNFLPFKNIKLFKSRTVLKKKAADSIAPPQEEKITFWRKLFQNPFIFLFLFVFVLAYFISYLPSKSLPVLEEGAIASADIIAPFDLTIEDTETTEKRRREAEEAVLPVYSYDTNTFLNTEEKIRQFFSASREWLKSIPARARRIDEFQKNTFEKFGIELSFKDIDLLARTGFSQDLEESLISLIGKVSEQGIILSKNLFIHKEGERGLTLLRGPGNEKTTKAEEILDVKESKERLGAEINSLDITQRNKDLLAGLTNVFLSPNITFNKVETEEKKGRGRERVETVFYSVKKGKVIIRKGDEATVENLKLIRIINQNLKEKPSWLTNFAGTFLLFALILVATWYYLKSLIKFRPALKNFLMMGTTLSLSLISYKLSVFLAITFSGEATIAVLTNADIYRYAFPYQFGVLIFAFLTMNQVSLVYAILNSLLVGYLFHANFYLMIFSLVGGFAAIYGIKYFEKQKRTSTLRAGLLIISPTNLFVILTIHLLREKMSGMGVFAAEALMGIVGGVLSAVLAFLFLPAFERIFGFVTQTKLLDLTNSDLPIFRQMAIEAPGSYHHSLIVASLTEKAAEEIHLDSMLVKAGALYHDIGKVKRPEYFIENSTRMSDMHRDLTPRMSTLVIINHVKEGVELARKLKLPATLREIIAQHHGNSLVRYFFQKAKEKYDPEMQTVGEESYRYPGPPPKSKEAALILLADSVEAASRSLKAPSRESLKRVIKDIFENYLQDGQLDECDFSLKELRTIAAAFLSTLYTIYHPRVEYPGFDFEGKKRTKKEKEKKPDDRNNRQPA